MTDVEGRGRTWARVRVVTVSFPSKLTKLLALPSRDCRLMMRSDVETSEA